MNVKLRAFSSIGPIQLLLEDQDDRLKRDVARMVVPDESLADVTAECLMRCFQQGIWSHELRTVVHFAAERIKAELGAADRG